jgi:hypothetical protein
VFLARSATSSLPPKFPPFTVDAWNGKAACLAKDQATREARTRTTKRYVTLDSLFFSYSLELEEAFHQQRTCRPQDFEEILNLHTYFFRCNS